MVTPEILESPTLQAAFVAEIRCQAMGGQVGLERFTRLKVFEGGDGDVSVVRNGVGKEEEQVCRMASLAEPQASILLLPQVMYTTVTSDDVVSASPDHQAIHALAYRYYQEEGRPEGRALDHWVRAEQTLTMEKHNGPRDTNGVPYSELSRLVAEGGPVPDANRQEAAIEAGPGLNVGSKRSIRRAEQRRRNR